MRISKSKREEIKKKFGGHCAYCGIRLNGTWEVDHLIPLRRNMDGSCKNPENHNDENFMPSCVSCNRDKGNYSLDEWRGNLYNKIDILMRNAPNYRIAKRFGLIEETNNDIVFFFEGYNNDR